ncbi:MAG TPA: hypothetical protein VF913_02245 [Xanthobacteraceae bacterium]
MIDLSGAGHLDRDRCRDPRDTWRRERRAQTRLEWRVETVSAAGGMGKFRHVAPAGKIPVEKRIPTVRRAFLREGDEAKIARRLFCCAPAKRIGILRRNHVFDL